MTDKDKDSQSYKSFIHFLRHWHRVSEETQAYNAARLGLSQGTFNNLLTGKKGASMALIEKVAAKIGLDPLALLAQGRALLEDEVDFVSLELSASGGLISPPPPQPLTDEDLASHDYLKISFRDDMRLFAGGGGAVEGTYDKHNLPVVVHRRALGLKAANARQLIAFRVGGDSMEPILAQDGIVLVDLAQNSFQRLRDGDIYALMWDGDDECAVKRLRWAQPGQLLAIESADPNVNPTIYRAPDEIRLVGRVIWSWRSH